MSSGQCPGVEIGNLGRKLSNHSTLVSSLLSLMFTQMAGVADTIHGDSRRALGSVAWSAIKGRIYDLFNMIYNLRFISDCGLKLTDCFVLRTAG